MSVIVPARDAAGTIRVALHELRRQDEEVEIVVVDDGSIDRTAEIAAGFGAHLVFTAGLGPARARNAGVRAASGAALAFLDADCRPADGWLAAGLAALRDADYVTGRTIPDPAHRRGPFDRSLSVDTCGPLYESANLFVTRSLFDRIGGFESWLRPRRGKELGEDVWLGWRARRAGARMAFCSEALAYHAVFRRGAVPYIGERLRLRFFPAIARRIPELRNELFFCRWFLTRRSAFFDAAVLAAAASRMTGRRLPWLLAAPYARIAWSAARPWGARRLPIVLAAGLVADAVGLAAALAGSLRSRTMLL